jgi:hypothetical protein
MGASEDNEKFSAFKDKDSRFYMGKFWRMEVFLDIEVNMDDEECFDDIEEQCSIFPYACTWH